MDEEECDYKSPIGRVIQKINIICKKPRMDNQLSEAIDVFNEVLNEQEKYLVNGIFSINYSESALFIQSCTQLFGKKVDLLWNDLLEYHTRLIRYDCEHQKENDIPLNEQVIQKLEERRNKYLRKKNFKLLAEDKPNKEVTPAEQAVVKTESSAATQPPETEKPIEYNGEYLMWEEGKLLQRVKVIFRDDDYKDELINRIQSWININKLPIVNIPPAVYQFMKQGAGLEYKHSTNHGEDYDIFDKDDGEFLTKFSRIPGVMVVLQLVDDNDRGVLPDPTGAMARLKLAAQGMIDFRRIYKIPLETPFKEFRKEYFEYCDKFVRDEVKRWKNMPENTTKQFKQKCAVIAAVDEENKRREKLNIPPLDADEEYEIRMRIVEAFDREDSESAASKEDVAHSDLYVRLEKLPGEIVNSKLRQDSGYYDCESENGDSDIGEAMEGEKETDVDSVPFPETSGAKSDNVGDNTDINSNNVDADKSVEEIDDDSFETRSFISDHDYCALPPVVAKDAVEEADSDKNNEKPVVAEEKSNTVLEKSNQRLDRTVEEVFKKPLGCARVVPKVVKTKELKKKLVDKGVLENGESPPKRRKLSQRQIEALLKGKIEPVRLLKFEKFFSDHYQAEVGEGKVPFVEYESDETDSEIEDAAANEDASPNEETTPIDNIHPSVDQTNAAEQDEVRSILTDHSYCQPPTTPDPRNDSGFVEPACLDSGLENDTPPEEPSFDFSNLEGPSLMEALRKSQEILLAKQKAQPPPPPPPPEAETLMTVEWREMRARVQEWRNTITPILRSLDEKDFDIHEYGSKIMEGMEVGDVRPFGDIVGNKTSSEVVRYFISSLQLANTNNIEICGARQGELSNDSYRVKLLDKDRYHEHLKDYTAPSKESLAEKLEKVKAMKESSTSSKSKAKKSQAPKVTKPEKGSLKNRMVVKITKLPSSVTPQNPPTTVVNEADQHNKENCNTLPPTRTTNAAKGKSIIKRQTTTPHILNFDLSAPSTSRQVYDPQMPSCSSQTYPASLIPQQEPPSRTYGSSPNKRRRSESPEEAFRERLATAQMANPDIQVHSTPNVPSPTKNMKISSNLKKTIAF